MRTRTNIFICIIFILVLAFLFLIFAPPLISMATESDEGDEAIAEIASNDGDINQAATSSSPSSSNSESQPAEGAGSNSGRAMEALLIANSDYSNFPKLGSPKTDALILGDSLRKLGFATRLVENASREQMLDEIKAFEERLRSTRGIAFFHFGGHGIQVKGSNYLVPADADIPDERRVSTRAVELNEVMGALDASGSEVNIVVLDACRDNPLPASATRSATRGLAVVGNKPKNSIVIYAAEAGSRATDGLFTPVLARELATPGISLAEIMTRVRKEVNEKSGGSQTPGEYNQLFEQVYFSRGKQLEEADKPVANVEVPRTKASEDEIRNSDLRAENQDSGTYKLFVEALEARRAGDMAKAVVKLEEAASQAPESPNIRYELGLVHEQMGAYDMATLNYKRIFEMGTSKAGKYYDLAAKKLGDGFDKPQKVVVTSEPTGAKVLESGSVIGMTPMEIGGQEPGKVVSYTIRLEGYEDGFVTGNVKVGETLNLSTALKVLSKMKLEVGNLSATTNTSTLSEVPSQFHGAWTSQPNGIGFEYDDAHLFVEARKIRGWEWSCDVVSVKSIGPLAIVVKSKGYAEGEAYDPELSLELSVDGSILMSKDKGEERWWKLYRSRENPIPGNNIEKQIKTVDFSGCWDSEKLNIGGGIYTQIRLIVKQKGDQINGIYGVVFFIGDVIQSEEGNQNPFSGSVNGSTATIKFDPKNFLPGYGENVKYQDPENDKSPASATFTMSGESLVVNVTERGLAEGLRAKITFKKSK